MGCTSSLSSLAVVTPSSKKTSSTKKTSDRIARVLQKKKGEVDKAGNPITFEKILLRFDRLRSVLAYIKAVFALKSEGKSGLNYDGLKDSLQILHGPMEKDQIIELFEFVDLDDSKVIEFKEFLVALTVGHVLEIMPDIHEDETSTKGARPSNLIEVNGLTCSAADINGVMNLIVSAYLLFDPNGKGFISRDAVSAMIEEGKGGRNAMLSQQRWNEMDWDANGEIDFPEFVHAFSSWVDIDEDDE